MFGSLNLGKLTPPSRHTQSSPRSELVSTRSRGNSVKLSSLCKPTHKSDIRTCTTIRPARLERTKYAETTCCKENPTQASLRSSVPRTLLDSNRRAWISTVTTGRHCSYHINVVHPSYADYGQFMPIIVTTFIVRSVKSAADDCRARSRDSLAQ